MISRYEQADMTALWTEESKLTHFLQVELALLKVHEKLGTVPKGVHAEFAQKSKIDVNRVNEIEKQTHHDVIAFCTSVTEKFPVDMAKFFHFGCTSSDVIDTALTLQIKKSLELIMPEFKTTLTLLLEKAEKYKTLLAMGRSHGMLAEPLSFGQKFLLAYSEFSRRHTEFVDFYNNELTGQMSGAVGNYTILTPEIEALVMKELGLKVEPVSTQIIPRDRIAKLATLVALYASALERFCIEIRHLHRSEVGEVSEGFRPGQKGSSTMPHKKNPIASENLSGIARILRSHLLVALENTLLWHERDISHSSAERLYLPDTFGLMLYSLRRMNDMIKNLVVEEAVIKGRTDQAYVALSSYYLHKLLPHYPGHREELYTAVQAASFKSKNFSEFQAAIAEHAQEKNITVSGLLDMKSVDDIYLKYTDELFKRVKETYPL